MFLATTCGHFPQVTVFLATTCGRFPQVTVFLAITCGRFPQVTVFLATTCGRRGGKGEKTVRPDRTTNKANEENVAKLLFLRIFAVPTGISAAWKGEVGEWLKPPVC